VATYREVFEVPEFGALFGVTTVQVAASTVQGLALGTIVYTITRSPLLASLAMFGSSFAQVVGALTLLSAADRVPPRAAMLGIGALFTVTGLLLAVPGLPVWALLLVTLIAGLGSAAGGGIKWGLLTEILPGGMYIIGRSVFNMSVGIMQIVGFAVSGVLVDLVSPRGALLVAAGLYLASALASRFAIRSRPARAAGRPSVRETLRVDARLWSRPVRRYIYLALWVPNGLIVGCEALFVPYNTRLASVLFVASAAGMLAGDTTMGRFVPSRWRRWLASPLRLLLAAPYLVFVLRPPFAVAVLAVGLASYGYSASLLLQDRLVAVTPHEIQGQALGLASAGTQTMQAVGAALTGAIAQWLSVPLTMTVTAVASVAVTLVLTPGLRQPARHPQPVGQPEPVSQPQPVGQPEPVSQPRPAGQSQPAPARPADPVSQ
jgi:MFS family permease